MIVTFEKEYLRELYEKGKCSDRHHRFQPQIVKKYTRTIDLMKKLANVMCLTQYGGLHYEALHGDKERFHTAESRGQACLDYAEARKRSDEIQGISSVKVNDQYRIEFREILDGDKTIAEVVSITELSNHYK